MDLLAVIPTTLNGSIQDEIVYWRLAFEVGEMVPWVRGSNKLYPCIGGKKARM